MSECLFCKIAAKDLEAEVVLETDGVIAFRDINPGAPTHVLVIPKEHIASAHELTSKHSEILAEMFEVMRSVADREDLAGGCRIVTNIGSDAGQSVHHLHFHVLGGRHLSWPPG
ncbi:MAG: HIT domain-containing protein [Actinomycetota bacterium]